MEKLPIPNLGIGIGLRPYHFKEIYKDPPAIDWFEIISENFMRMEGLNFDFLEFVLDRYPVVQHGVSLCIGSVDPLDFDYLKRLKRLARKTKTPWISDHLSWGKLKGAHFHDLLPLPFTKKTAEYVIERAKIVQDFLEIPFALENLSSYASFVQDEMPEWEFYSTVVEKADVYMMLDVNNIYVSSKNHGFSPQEYCSHLPMERVLQIHLAGHTRKGNWLIDTHNNFVCDEVWDLYSRVYPLTRGVSTLLEWDQDFIPLKDTCSEAFKAKQFVKDYASTQ